ncbi:zinc-dependent metalloprotease [Mucilaginibacter paludis]|uniref:Peptidase M10A and M12B matrixin and adamalysin n=1 Tax=Mucilaginibacter paludis DSM 18603 TaxID=714943 RepID=H1YBP0_9SPHI|nr:zinc-dependent metalloprotease [Mucilaginibacter paludis]EHQ26003.1 hypothetical protein Mucpa_1851 [Mucilaginibacter paludis DSM 18603]
MIKEFIFSIARSVSFIFAFTVLPCCCFSQGVIWGGGGLPSAGPVAFNKLIKPNARVNKGMFTIYTTEGHYYLRINDTLLNRPMMVVSRVVQSSAGTIDEKNGIYGGDGLGESDITFDKANGKINIRNLTFAERSKDNTQNGLLKALNKNNLAEILMSWDIKAYGPDSTSTVIDITELLTGNSNLMTGHASTLNYQSDKSFVEDIRSFPANTEIRTFKTYGIGKGDTTNTIRINTSFVLLPDKPMHERALDARIGYFTPYNVDYDRNPQQAKLELKISRWRLQPKPADMDKYRRGELVEPVKPIIFYIDPATPKQWVPYLKMGVDDWQAAFERAGFKNAIFAREVSPSDSTWSMNDARYSVIVYKPSFIANAAGPTIIDPRSGEIMESHVSWYHNVMTLLHNWYMLQAGMVDTAAQKPEFSTELMGQLIRFVSSHEIGHTLGLKHNFGSSSTVPVDSLRNKKWVELHGHTPSIMDYARFNYVAQPEDHISTKGIFPRIGDYDKWAIEWGYRVFPDITDERKERHILFNLVTDSLKNNKRLFYGEQSFLGIIDPRSQTEDLSNDVIAANTYGLKNLKRIVTRLPSWTFQYGDQFGENSGNSLKRTHPALLGQYFTYLMHAVNCIGLGYYNNLTSADTGRIFEPAPKLLQQRAMSFLNKEVFSKEPAWIAPEAITSQVWNPQRGLHPQLLASDILSALLAPQRLINLYDASVFYHERTFTLDDFLSQLKDGLWPELKSPVAVSHYHMVLQQQYVDNMLALISSFKNHGLSALVRAHLTVLQKNIERVAPLVKDTTTQYHYRDLLIQLKRLSSSV